MAQLVSTKRSERISQLDIFGHFPLFDNLHDNNAWNKEQFNHSSHKSFEEIPFSPAEAGDIQFVDINA